MNFKELLRVTTTGSTHFKDCLIKARWVWFQLEFSKWYSRVHIWVHVLYGIYHICSIWTMWEVLSSLWTFQNKLRGWKVSMPLGYLQGPSPSLPLLILSGTLDYSDANSTIMHIFWPFFFFFIGLPQFFGHSLLSIHIFRSSDLPLFFSVWRCSKCAHNPVLWELEIKDRAPVWLALRYQSRYSIRTQFSRVFC